MPGAMAHVLSEKQRTRDVILNEEITFSDLLLSESTLRGLDASGFQKPSPIQKKAIPLGRCGFDLIVQSKSGTGKTCVFTVIALEMVKTEIPKLQVLILCPTREISVQIRDVFIAIGRDLKNFKVEAFIGGIPLEHDKKSLHKCHVAVGAPGRIKHLISEGLMQVNAVRLFVLDEADKLMEDSFRNDISFIYLRLPEIKQMIAASATFPSSLEDFVTRYMTNPMKVSPGKDVFLLGVRQFVSVIPSHLNVFVQMKNKVAELLRILSIVPFKQCLIFSNYQSRAESICNRLNKEGWSAEYISGSQNQTRRLKAMSSLKEFRCRILLSTDLTSRGIDAEHVNLVINLDLPFDGPTYMHRIGRAGRYGTHALAITIVQSGAELEQFRKMIRDIGGEDFSICLFPEKKFTFNIWESNDDDFEKILGVEGGYKYSKVGDKREGRSKNKKEKKDDKERNALIELFDSYLSLPKKVKVSDFETLVETESKFQIEEPQKNKSIEKENEFEDFPSEIKCFYANLEVHSWEVYKKSLEENPSPVGVSSPPTQKISLETDEREVFDLKKDEDYNESDEYDENSEDYESESDVSRDKKDFETEAEGSFDEETATSETETSEEIFRRDSTYLRQWYSLWYQQMSEVRQYVNYLRYCYYWKEILNQR